MDDAPRVSGRGNSPDGKKVIKGDRWESGKDGCQRGRKLMEVINGEEQYWTEDLARQAMRRGVCRPPEVNGQVNTGPSP